VMGVSLGEVLKREPNNAPANSEIPAAVK
jgi:hypothetical protein